MRGSCKAASVVQASVLGSHVSAGRTPLVETRLTEVAPPTASALPSGSSTKLWLDRAKAIGAVCRHVGEAWFRSITLVVVTTGSLSLGGLPPAASSTLPGKYMAEVPNEGGLIPRFVQI